MAGSVTIFDPGLFSSHTDWRGVVTSVAAITSGVITELQRTFTVGTDITIESLLYSGGTVTFRTQFNGGSWTPVQQITYTFYGSSDPNGSLGDLQSAGTAPTSKHPQVWN